MSLTAKNLAEYIRDAASIRTIVETRIQDINFVENEGTIFYAVDTNIIKFFTESEKISHAFKGRKGYAEIFRGEKRKNVSLLGRVLVEYIFHDLTNEIPLIQIPPHEEETQRVYSALARNTEKDINDLSDSSVRVKKLWSVYQEDNNKLNFIEGLKKNTSQLLKLLCGGESRLDELKRFSNLLKNQRLCSFRYLYENPAIVEELDVSILSKPCDIRNMINYSDSKATWFSLLMDEKSSSSNLNTNDDADVLARLELINNRLAEDNKKLILITGDKAIINVTNTVTLTENSTFGDLYIRHPKALIADNLFFDALTIKKVNHEESTAQFFTLIDWLDVFLSEFSNPHDRDYIRNLKEIQHGKMDNLILLAKDALKHNKFIGADLIQDWDALTNNLGFSKLIDSNARQYTEDEVINKLMATLASDDFDNIINDVVNDAWKDFIEVAVESGLYLLYTKDLSQFTSRNTPIIRFVNQKYTKNFVESFLTNSENVTEDLLMNVLKEDKTKYSYYVAFAVLYASAERWKTANKLARLALDISNEDDRAIEYQVYGHEAAYLCAVSMRRSSQQIDNLKNVEYYISEAEKRLKKLSQSLPELQLLPDHRFDHERVALSLTYWLYAIFIPPDQQMEHESVTLKNIMSLGVIGYKLLELLPAINEKCNMTDNEIIWRSLKIQAISNLFMTSLLQCKENGNLDELLKCSDYMDIYKPVLNDNVLIYDGVKYSFSQKVIYLTVAALIYKNTEKIKAKKKLSELLENENITKYSVLPYDKKRYRFLLELANFNN